MKAMAKRVNSLIVSTALLVVSASQCFASDENLSIDNVEHKNAALENEYKRLGKAWGGLDDAEVKRYLELKESPRGYFTPNLNPIMALGLEARTEAERMKYARMWDRLELENFNKIKAWYLAIQRVAAERPDQDVIRFSENPLKSDSVPHNGKSVKITLELDNCSSCMDSYHKYIEYLKNGEIETLELVFVNATKQDINKWAKAVNLPVRYNAERKLLVRVAKADEVSSRIPDIQYY